MTVQLNETGDTVKVSTVTDRTRASVRDRVKDVEVKIVEKTDTVYVAVRDSVSSVKFQDSVGVGGNRPSAFVSALKWIFWIIVSLTVFIIIIKLFIFK